MRWVLDAASGRGTLMGLLVGLMGLGVLAAAEPTKPPAAGPVKPAPPPAKPAAAAEPIKSAKPDELDVLAGFAELEKPGEMMTRYLLDQIAEAEKKWLQDSEARKTPEQIAAYQEHLKKEFIQRIGGLPTERAPLNGKVVGQQKRRRPDGLLSSTFAILPRWKTPHVTQVSQNTAHLFHAIAFSRGSKKSVYA